MLVKIAGPFLGQAAEGYADCLGVHLEAADGIAIAVGDYAADDGHEELGALCHGVHRARAEALDQHGIHGALVVGDQEERAGGGDVFQAEGVSGSNEAPDPPGAAVNQPVEEVG